MAVAAPCSRWLCGIGGSTARSGAIPGAAPAAPPVARAASRCELTSDAGVWCAIQ
jgi:hypothetical protein